MRMVPETPGGEGRYHARLFEGPVQITDVEISAPFRPPGPPSGGQPSPPTPGHPIPKERVMPSNYQHLVTMSARVGTAWACGADQGTGLRYASRHRSTRHWNVHVAYRLRALATLCEDGDTTPEDPGDRHLRYPTPTSPPHRGRVRGVPDQHDVRRHHPLQGQRRGSRRPMIPSALTACGPEGEYEVAPATATSDSECADITPCSEGEYEVAPATATSEYAVRDPSLRAPRAEYEVAPATTTSDTECADGHPLHRGRVRGRTCDRHLRYRVRDITPAARASTRSHRRPPPPIPSAPTSPPAPRASTRSPRRPRPPIPECADGERVRRGRVRGRPGDRHERHRVRCGDPLHRGLSMR